MKKVRIEPLDTVAMEECRLRIDNLTKPIYSLAQLEMIAERLAGIFKIKQPKQLKKAMVIFAGDHAADGMQNQTHGGESLAVLKRLDKRRSPTDAAARAVKAPVYLVNVGLEQNTESLENVRTEVIMEGSRFFGRHAAMSEEETGEALEIGFALAEELHAQGVQLVGLGNVGERAQLTALAVTAAVTGYPIESLLTQNECTLSETEKAKRLKATLQQYEITDTSDIVSILQSVGAPDIAAMTGFVLGAASLRMAVVFDNAVTGAAVLLAVKEDPLVADYVFQSASYEDPVHQQQMHWLNRKSYLYYDFSIEEGLGSAMGLSLIDASLHMLNDMKTFGEAAVNVAEDGPGNIRQDIKVN